MSLPARALAALVAASGLARTEARLGGGANSSAQGVSAEDLRAVEAGLLENPFPRGSTARGRDYWANATSPLVAALDGLSVELVAGYEYMATTTRYGDTCCASCGSLDTAKVVKGTEYYAVASAQAMQDSFAGGSCCWCGEAGQGSGPASGVAPMGCGTCAKGRFIPKRPYEAPMWGSGALFEKEVKIVVADICPHTGNEAWCPERPGETNEFGSKNHFDFAAPPAEFDNYYFAFTPEPCPSEVQQALSMSQCSFL